MFATMPNNLLTLLQVNELICHIELINLEKATSLRERKLKPAVIHLKVHHVLNPNCSKRD